MSEFYAVAKARGLVRLADGTTARLVYFPGTRQRKAGGKAKVQRPSGAWLSVPPESLTLAEPSQPLTNP